MPKQIKLFRLFVASPSDLDTERAILSELVTEWNIQHGQLKNVNIEVASWHTHSYPSYGERPQELINKQVFDSSDIVVGLFWTRFGSPTGVANSGTEEEIKRGIEQNKKVMVYFSDKAFPPSKLNIDDYQKIQAFKNEFRDKGLYYSFQEEEDFRRLFRLHLAAVMDEILMKHDPDNVEQDPTNPIIPISLSAQYWIVVLAGLDPLVETSFAEMDALRKKGTDINNITQPMRTALVGPLIARGIIIDELAKQGIVNKEGKDRLGLESLHKKVQEVEKKNKK